MGIPHSFESHENPHTIPVDQAFKKEDLVVEVIYWQRVSKTNKKCHMSPDNPAAISGCV